MASFTITDRIVPFHGDIGALLPALAAEPNPFLLESGLCMPRLGRHCFLGSRPFLVMTARGHRIVLQRGEAQECFEGNPFTVLRRLLAEYRTEGAPDGPFCGGAVGYLGYDLGRCIERLPCTTLDDSGLPDLYLAFYDCAAVVDAEAKTARIAAADFGLPGRAPAEERMGRLAALLASPPAPFAPDGISSDGELACNFTRTEYLRAVQRAKDYIAAGDIFQVNLSRRFETRLPTAPHVLYRRLRTINPAPMAAYLQFDDNAVVSASPERFLKVRGRHVETRPIKGTRPRGKTPAEDAALAQELLASAKDNAELAMIVDLERNDLGRVCAYGSVRVTEPRALESFPTVHHLVATVEGDLHPRQDRVDLLRAAFPGGSITGAPKIRAMEIIDELEPTRRSAYTGAIGYFGCDGSMDLNIVIRTFLVQGNRVTFQVGGGIVADSGLDQEYEETTHKAEALLRAAASVQSDPPR